MKSTKPFYLIAGAIILFLLIVIMYDRCSKPSNESIDSIVKPISQKTTEIRVNDSVRGIEQSLLIASDKSTILKLQDSLQALINRKANVTPTTIIKFRENIAQTNLIGHYQDSLSGLIDALLSAKNLNGTLMSPDSLEAFKARILSRTEHFTVTTDKWTKIKGNFDYHGNVKIDSLSVISEPFITVGEKGGFLKRRTIAVTVGNNNPNITNSNLSSFTYVPKPKLQFAFSAIGLSDGKTLVGGPGIILKKGIISVSVGYLALNTKLK